MAPSPLFPDGRIVSLSVDDVTDEATGLLTIPNGFSFNEEYDKGPYEIVNEFVTCGYTYIKFEETIIKMIDELGEVDKQHLEDLRQKYGSKAANLICFEEAIQKLKKLVGNEPNFMNIKIPPYLTVSVDVYQRWADGDLGFEAECESLRTRTLALDEQDGYIGSFDLVVVRSSAVNSEDGEKHTGAGIYKSVAVDPRDKEAFRCAIEEVYNSTNSPSALVYQASNAVEAEQMGLVVQAYHEEIKGSSLYFYFGHANSQGANKNILEQNTQLGSLQYDKHALMATLMNKSSVETASKLLHLDVDHLSDMCLASINSSHIPHATVLAEKFFGKPMQVEFVGNLVVQVRPIIVFDQAESITFPEDIIPAVECMGAGTIDDELRKISVSGDNSKLDGYVVLSDEYMFSEKGNYSVFPKSGVVILLNKSRTGHVQALCKEKGVACFYPKDDETRYKLMDLLYDEDDESLTNNKTLRFVSDGYVGRIYIVEPEVAKNEGL